MSKQLWSATPALAVAKALAADRDGLTFDPATAWLPPDDPSSAVHRCCEESRRERLSPVHGRPGSRERRLT
jgi:hypothetical protein